MVTSSDILAAPPADRLSLPELAREEGVAPPTPWRWAMRGVRGLRLPTAMIGHRRVTTRAAFSAWCVQLTLIADGRHQQSREDPQRQVAIDRAEAELRQLGV